MGLGQRNRHPIEGLVPIPASSQYNGLWENRDVNHLLPLCLKRRVINMVREMWNFNREKFWSYGSYIHDTKTLSE